MVERVIKLPDVGEGVAEAELVEWHVKIGDLVREDALIATVMTDKATVEIPSPVEGEIVWLCAEVGDLVAVGSDLVRLKVPGDETIAAAPDATEPPMAGDRTVGSATSVRQTIVAIDDLAKRTAAATSPRATAANLSDRATASGWVAGRAPRAEGEKPIAAPAVRLRAREAGIDLRQVPGTGPAGRIMHEDLDAFFAKGPTMGRAPGLQAKTAVTDIKMVGLRRKIAEKVATAYSRIPHITYVEEVDVTALEALRATLNREKRPDQPKLTLIPFLIRAVVLAVAEQPRLNALFDDEAGVVHQHTGVHIGIAAQTALGLMVPVVRHAEARDLWDCAAEVTRLAETAKAGTANRDDLIGSTITITSLGAMGGLVTTPIINHPEVTIVGVNKIVVRPVWDQGAFVPRKMMNLSSSFDHRVVDGWDAANFVQRIKALLEEPALLFMEG